VQAADFIAAHIAPRHGRVINDFNWGGYLAWRLNPKFQVFMDGRTQLYTPAYWQVFGLGDVGAMTLRLQQIQADAALLPNQPSRLRDALHAVGWTSVYEDDRAVVLQPPPQRLAGP
jgi:hypothetical protein